MPSLKQPIALEAMALKSLVHMLCELGEKLMPMIAKLAKSEAQRSSDLLDLRIKRLQKIFEYNVPCFLYDRLCEEIFVQVPAMIERIKGQLKLRSSMGEFLSKVNVAVSLTEVVISSNLRKLNFEHMPKMIRHIYYSKLNLLSGLTYLNLGSLSGGWKTDDMEPAVLMGVKHMKYLRYFCLNYDCTDNILLALVECCPKLHTLDVQSSKSLTNDSIHILCRFDDLRIVQLFRTSVTMEGFVNLLLKLPRLEDVGRYDEIGRCLEYITQYYPNKEKFGLTKFSSRFVTTKYIQILAEYCPEILFVSIFYNLLLCDLMTLIGINKLNDLRLLSCDFFADQVRNVLQVKGCNLTHLHLEHVDEIDMNALMYISQFCPDLKSLTFYNCEMLSSTSMYTRKPAIPPFMNLERLTLVALCELSHLEFLLSTCYKIKYISLGTMVPTHDFSFEKILCANPMANLKELSIVCSEGLTISMAYKLIEVCNELTVLNELEGWVQIEPIEIELFKKFIKLNNLDLNIQSKRFTCD